MKTTPPPLIIPSDLDWPTVSRQVCEATRALARLRVGLAPTDAAWLTSHFDPVAHDLGVARVALANRAPVPLDFGDVEDPVDVPAVPSPRRKPITPDQWRELSADAELLHDNLVALAGTPQLDPRLTDRFDRAAEVHRRTWQKLVEVVETPADNPQPTRPRYRPAKRGSGIRPRRKSG